MPICGLPICPMRLRPLLRFPEFPVILAPFILFAPVLFGKALFWGTPALQFHPWHVFAWETLISGQLPLWNPLSGLGAPLIANYQSALFYPPNWIYFLLGAIGGETAGEPLMAWGMGLLAAAHLSLAGVGMVRLARELGLSALAQTVSGLAFGLSGYLVARAHFLSVNAAVAWLPWILWASYRVASAGSVSAGSNPASDTPNPSKRIRDSVRFNALGISNTGFNRCLRLAFLVAILLLAGHAQTAWYTLLLAGAWVIFWGWNKHPRSSAFIRVLFLFILSTILGAALAAIQLLPTAELLSQS
ncbi:MAG: hypothetical protein L0209_10555, partial [candidate division Zixibacteria bacterium]|nr:hypothetical protein [candidate division Zixibacteria bacterium]